MKKLAGWLLVLCLCVQLALPAGVLAAAGQEPITIASLVRVARYISGAGTLTPQEMQRYDFDGNGVINIADLTRMARILSGGGPPPAEPPADVIGELTATDYALALVPGAGEEDVREVRLEQEDGQWVYEVEIVYGGFTYECEMMAADGTVLEWGFEHNGPLTPAEGDVGLGEATRIALDRVPGASEQNITYLRPATEDGVAIYEGEILHGGRRYTFEIQAATGEFTEWGYEPYPDAPGPSPVPMPTMPPEPGPSAEPSELPYLAIADYAVSYVPGSTQSDIQSIRTVHKYGRLVCEVEMTYLGTEHEFIMDAYTGELLSWDWETPAVPGPAGVDIGRDAARRIALEQVPGAPESSIVGCNRDMKDGVPIYEVELRYDGYKFEFDIVSGTGVICQYSRELLIWGSGLNPAPEATPTMTGRPTETAAPTAVPGPTASVAPTPAPSAGMDRETAQQLVLSRVPGATMADFVEFKLDRENGRLIYECELRYDGVEYEIELDAATGAVLKWEMDRYAPPSADPTGLISRNRAIQVALARVPGATEANVRKCQLDADHGVPVYEVEIRIGRVEYELKIDAHTAVVLEFEMDD